MQPYSCVIVMFGFASVWLYIIESCDHTPVMAGSTRENGEPFCVLGNSLLWELHFRLLGIL